MPRYSKWIRVVLLVLMPVLLPLVAAGQGLLPSADGQERLYNVRIEMEKGGMTGVCMMLRDSTGLHGSVVNEFGVGLMSFTYEPERDKVRLHSVFGKMDKWYIRRTLRRDLRRLVHAMRDGSATYTNDRRGIRYAFTPINEDDTAR